MMGLESRRPSMPKPPARREIAQMARDKDVLTTGEVAKLCNVAPRTVSKWFDSGQLKGYRIPGSKDRRIPMPELIRFMKEHGIPVDGLMSGKTRVLVVDSEPEVLDALQKLLTEHAHYEVRTSSSAFLAGLECERFKPSVVLLDLHVDGGDGREILAALRKQDDLQLTKMIGMSGKLTDGQAHQIKSSGFDGFLKKPFNIRQVITSIEETMALVY